MNKFSVRNLVTIALSLLIGEQSIAQINRLPAYPLITHDPYFSIWSFTDEGNTSDVRHWTGAFCPILGLMKVDGTVYHFFGEDKRGESASPSQPAGPIPAKPEAAEQQRVNVNATPSASVNNLNHK